ncbi:MAG: right-handed parallel beta-helix repeat-containing protein, partial [Acidimicrobiia bacterium]|nr:right-handed parallel beta-helix repeat-containing protein [Acidimicrobiia bacterium]
MFDKELIDAANWAGTSLTVTRQGGADSRDEFAATGTLDAITEGASIVIDGVTVGTVTTNSGGTLRLDFDTGSTEARVSRVLQSLGYVNESRETGTVTMAWTFDDGVGAPANGTVDVTIIVLGISVNSTGDASDATPGDETCDTGSTNSEGDPECTLRAAMEELNAIGGGDITFTIPASDAGHSAGIWTMAPGSDLPAITGTVDLDATTQTGWAAWSPVVAIDGTGLAEGQALVTVDSIASATRVAGLSIIGSDVEGIDVASGASGVVLEDLVVGLPPGGGSAPGNGTDGITLAGDSATVANSVISGSGSAGIRIAATATGAVVTGNRIGTDLDGTGSFGNGSDGIVVLAGGAAVGSVGDGNTIVASTSAGIRFGSSATGVAIANRIGIDAADTVVGVGTDGIVVAAGASPTIGGTGAGEGNLITGAGGDGIRLDATAGETAILGNTIYGNTQTGIDLNADGLTPNDAGDGDSGANDLLNFPEIISPLDRSMQVAFDLDVPAGDYRVELFANPTEGADPSGYGEGETFLAGVTVTHTGSGIERFIMPVGAMVQENDVLTATATEDLGGGSYGATSEFSEAVVVGDLALTVNSTGDGSDTFPGDGACETGGTNSEGDPECTLRAAIEEANAYVTSGPSSGVAIEFVIPASDPGYATSPRTHWTLTPASPLPSVTEYVLVNATTQTGWAAFTPVVYVDGSASGATDLFHFDTGSTSSVLQGLGIVNAPTTAVRADDSYIYVLDTVVGVDVDGVTGAGSGGDALVFNDRYGEVRDSVISASGGAGIRISTLGRHFNAVDSRIGTGADGTGALGNTGGGVVIDGDTNHSLSGNVIAHNPIDVQVNGAADWVLIRANRLGVDLADVGSAGSVPLEINTSGWVRVGGENPTDGNIIRYGTDAGITVNGTGTVPIL